MWSDFITRDSALMRQLRMEHNQATAHLPDYRRPPFLPNTSTSPFNINERVFNMVIKNHIEDIECFDCLQIFWDRPWGANVPFKIVGT